MNPLLLSIFSLLTAHSAAPTGGDIETWGKIGDELVDTCEQNPSQLVKRYFSLRNRAEVEKKAFDKMPASLVRSVVENERYYLLRDVFPEALPETLNGKSVFTVCAIQFESLNLSLRHLGKSQEAQDDLKAWRYCVDDSYRDTVPVPLKKLQACYSKIVK